jgi:hypothetical protein
VVHFNADLREDPGNRPPAGIHPILLLGNLEAIARLQLPEPPVGVEPDDLVALVLGRIGDRQVTPFDQIHTLDGHLRSDHRKPMAHAGD